MNPAESAIVMYQTDDGGTRIEVRLENETVWLSQAQMAELFQRERSVITKHIGNALREGEFDARSNVQYLHIAKSDRPVAFYSLDVTLSVGYRVKSLKDWIAELDEFAGRYGKGVLNGARTVSHEAAMMLQRRSIRKSWRGRRTTSLLPSGTMWSGSRTRTDWSRAACARARVGGRGMGVCEVKWQRGLGDGMMHQPRDRYRA